MISLNGFVLLLSIANKEILMTYKRYSNVDNLCNWYGCHQAYITRNLQLCHIPNLEVIRQIC